MSQFWIKGLMVGIGLVLGCQAFAQPNNKGSSGSGATVSTEKPLAGVDIDAALVAQEKKCPQVHQDAMRVWKKFKSGTTDPNYTYRFWARDIVLWLRKNRGASFEREEKVGEVFKILYDKRVISKDAEHVLTLDVWSFLINREGMPERERGLPLYDRSQMDKVEHEV